MPSFGQWLRQKMRTRDHKQSSADGQMPILPAKRPCMLSPSPSHESLAVSAAAATANSAFYQRLPVELRRLILVEAFGGRIVHMDLSLDYPAVFMSDSEARLPGNKIRHCGLERKRDISKPKAWHWFGCVCHLDPEERVRGNDLLSEPWTDDCLDGSAAWCRGWSGEAPNKCFLGIMGWLQTSRQAYMDGIEILYTSNNFHMSSLSMICHLSDLLLHQRLASITSVQMVWRLDEIFHPGQVSETSNSPKVTFESLLQAITRSLPNLRKLYVCLLGPSYMPVDDPARRPESDILMPVDGMVRALGSRLEEFDLALPSTIFRPYWEENIRKGHKFEQRNWVSDRIWRTLDPAENSKAECGEDKGYWLRQGKDDIYYPYTSCF